MFGWDPEKIVVENQLIGGGFGGKEDVKGLMFIRFYVVRPRGRYRRAIRFNSGSACSYGIRYSIVPIA